MTLNSRPSWVPFRLGGDASLYQKLKLVKEIREENPNGPYKKILREQYGMVA